MTAIATRSPMTDASIKKLVAYEAGRVDCHHVEAGLLGVQDAAELTMTITPDLGMYAKIANGEISLRFTQDGIEVSEGPRSHFNAPPLWPHYRLDEADPEAQADVLAQVLAALRIMSTRRNGEAMDMVSMVVTFTDGATAEATYYMDVDKDEIRTSWNTTSDEARDRLAALCFTA